MFCIGSGFFYFMDFFPKGVPMPGQLYSFVLPLKLKTELEKICNEEQ